MPGLGLYAQSGQHNLEKCMEQERKKINACLINEPPFCTALCPFHLDVRSFIGKMQRGGFNAAFRVYHDTVGFPEIVSHLCEEPCKKACIRQKKDQAISMKLLEQASINYAARITPNSYNMPAKNKTIAIIGAGISGLACALRLCEKKYAVTVYEKADRIGGHLWQTMLSEIFLSDINRRFMYEKYTLHLNTEITSLEELNFDAIYVATGAGGRNFGLMSDKKGTFASAKPGIFLGGSLMGKNSCEAIADGLHVVNAIERYVKTGNMNTQEEKYETQLQLNSDRLTIAPPVLPADGNSYTKDEAQQEVQRCIKCSCDACIRNCDLMRIYQKHPKVIADQVEATVNPGTLAGDGTIATRLISTCNQCGLCKEVCPQGIDLGVFLLKSHRVMKEKEKMPWAFHDFWLRDMEFTNGDSVHLARIPDEYNKSSYMFFPGCQLGASDPRYITESYRWLLAKQPDTAIMLGCCGAPAEWAGDVKLHSAVLEKILAYWVSFGKPKAVFACPTCKKMFKQYLPAIDGVTLYELFLEWGISPVMNGQGEAISVFDPCASRGEPELQHAIRNLASQSGYSLQPLALEGKLAQCCSWGGQVAIANPRFTNEVVKIRVRQNSNPYITYCSNCRDIFALAEKPVYHMLDIIFGLNTSARKSPTLTERRNNRTSLKSKLLKEIWQDELKEKGDNKMNLIITPEIRQKLNNEMILETDAEAVIKNCESSKNKVFHPDSGSFTGNLKIGNVTYWVEYIPVDKGVNLLNAYSHRMSVEE